MDAPVIDRTKLESFLVRAVGDLSAGYGGVMVSLGSKLGLYKAMSGAGPISSKELAARTGCAERYVSEWLNAQAAGGYVGYHAVSDTYELSPEQAMVLADEDSPVFIPNAWQVPASMWFDEEKAIEAFRTGKGVAWGEHDGRLYCGSSFFWERFSCRQQVERVSQRETCRTWRACGKALAALARTYVGPSLSSGKEPSGERI